MNLHGLKKQVRLGKVCIIAKVSEGPHQGVSIALVTGRDSLATCLQAIKSMDEGIQTRLAERVARTIRNVLMVRAEPTQNQDFTHAVGVMLCLQMTSDAETYVSNSGLKSIMLLIDSDTSLPWDQRGLLVDSRTLH